MLSAVLVVGLLSCGHAATISDATYNDNGYCYGFLGGDKWCWLSSDGSSNLKEGDDGYSCWDYNGYSEEDYCKGASHKSQSHAKGSSGSSKGSLGLDDFLQSLKGEENVDCGGVCKAAGGSNMGYSMSSEGEVAYFDCSCGSVGKITVACTGSPYMECCKDKCEGTDCPESPKGWECPKGGGCPLGGCSGDWKDWVAAHNIYRCMHDVPPVVWDARVFKSVKDHFQYQRAMEHSKCYDVPAPAGPAGENLFKGSGSYNAMDAVSGWYSEIKECGSFPGCDRGKKGTVGHFTAMVWHGDKEIGCLANRHNLFACRYKALDYKSCNTPNYGGSKSYPKNVFPRVRSYSTCKSKVRRCGFKVSEPKSAKRLNSRTGLSLVSDRFKVPNKAAQGKDIMFPVVAFSVAAVAVMAFALVVRRKRQRDARDTVTMHLESEMGALE